MLANPRTLRGVVETLLFCVFLYINAKIINPMIPQWRYV